MSTRPAVLPVALAVALTAALVASAVWFFVYGGATGTPVIHLQVRDADGLQPGHPVVLKGVRIGQVASVNLQGEGVVVDLAVPAANLSRLDLDTIFVIRPANLADFSKVVVADNLCVKGSPTGLADGTSLRGYSGNLALVVIEAGADRPGCAAQLVEDLARRADQSMRALLSPPQ